MHRRILQFPRFLISLVATIRGVWDRHRWTAVVLVLIILVALGLRLHGLNWDSGYGFHPDERDIYMRSDCMYQALTDAPRYQNCGYLQDHPETVPGLPSPEVFLDPERSPLNPHWFPLGSILIYTLVGFRFLVELFTDVSALDMRYVGRSLSALADVGSVLLMFALGRRLYGNQVGLLAAALTSLAVIHVQNSHFYRPETFAAFFALAGFWGMFQMLERKRFNDSVLVGVLIGLALAPKASAAPLLLPLALAYGYRLWDSLRSAEGDFQETPHRTVVHGTVALLATALVFVASSPYALLDYKSFAGDLSTQSNMVRNAGIWPFTVQYVGTTPFLYQIKQTAVFGLGLPLGIVAWLAIPFTAATLFWRTGRRRNDILILAFILATMAMLESFEVRFQRYLFTLMPLMILLGARMLFSPLSLGGLWPSAYRQSWEAQPRYPRGWGIFRLLRWIPLVVITGVVVATAFFSLAFQQVYSQQHPAVTASQWINANIDPGTRIISDNHWDEFVPDLYGYQVWQYPVYEPETISKMKILAQRLEDSDYLVFYSNRPFTSVSRDPDRFPFSTFYYQELFDGNLGYRLERTFTSYPRLLGMEFRDDPIGDAGLPQPNALSPVGKRALSFNLGFADDNVVGYDHPQVLLFRNHRGLATSSILERLVGNQPVTSLGEPGGLMLSDSHLISQREGGTWSRLIRRESWTNRLPVLAWLLVVELVYLVALPLSIFIFRPLPDRGIIMARILGLLGVAYLAWLSVSLGWLEFSRIAIAWGFLGLLTASGLVMGFRGAEIRRFITQRWRLLLGAETLFLLAFLAFVALRAANPDLWHPWRGGEKPMEFAYFNAVIRSTTMPPFDPWFSGGYLNYYYWGYFIPAALVQITGILPAIAFNLAVPLFFALTITGAFSVVYNLAEGVRRSRGGPAGRAVLEDPTRGFWDFKSPVAAGLFGSLFIGVIGNLDGVVQVVQGVWGRMFQSAAGFTPFDFWRSSRMIPFQENFTPSPLVFWVSDKVHDAPDMSPHITEFPFFTFLFADLHAHMMAIPFTLLVIGLGLNLVAGLRREGWLWAAVSTLALGLAVGSLWVINSWDYPSYLLLVLTLLGVAVYLRGGSLEAKSGLLLVLATLAGVSSIVAFLPFHQAYEAFNTGLEASKWRTPVDRYIGIYGLFLFIALTFLIYQFRAGINQSFSSMEGSKLSSVRLHRGRLAVMASGLLFVVLLAVAGYWTGAVLMAALSATGLAGWHLLASGPADAVGREPGAVVEDKAYTVVPFLLLAMGLSISIGLDFLRVTGDIGRMNTVFKYYLEVWVLFSLASAYMLWRLLESEFLLRLVPTARGVWVGILILLLGSSLIYTVWGTKDRLADRFDTGLLTLDGEAFLNRALYSQSEQMLELKWDLAAIHWLQDNGEGSPVVLEAHGEQYGWNARIANYTGLPTVLGWPWHQTQQRTTYAQGVFDRAAHVTEMYNTRDLDRLEQLLRGYKVEYIVVGELERVYYQAQGLEKFALMEAQGGLERVYENREVTIYRTSWD